MTASRLRLSQANTIYKYQWQLYNPDGIPKMESGATMLEAVMHGLFHGVSHVWIWRRQKNGTIELLFQRRPLHKIKWPGKLEKSAGGHMWFREKPEATAVRKAWEELGIELKAANMRSVGTYNERALIVDVQGHQLIEYERQHIFLVEMKQAKLAPARGINTTWKSVDKIRADLANPGRKQAYVPYSDNYFERLIRSVAEIV